MQRRGFVVVWAAGLLALLWGIALQVSVALDLAWVRTRAAGGGFDHFPVWVRIGYVVQAAFLVFLTWVLWRHRDRALPDRFRPLARIVGFLFVISTFAQVLSRSPDERWNAIATTVIAMTFILLSQQTEPRGK